MPELFSVNEAAAIAEVSPDIIRTALEKKTVKASHTQRVGQSLRHRFSVGDVLLLKLLAEFPFPLSKGDKESLALILRHGSEKAAHWSSAGPDLVYRSGEMEILIQCKSFRQIVDKNLATYRWGRRRVVSLPGILGGDPVFRGTRIPLRHVASLFRKGVPDAEIAEDFPALGPRDLAYARLVARVGDRPGRPKKRLAFRREHGVGE
jgi:uncharacterized protein (DUF433 family)